MAKLVGQIPCKKLRPALWRISSLFLLLLIALNDNGYAQQGWLNQPTQSHIGKPEVHLKGQGKALIQPASEWLSRYLPDIGNGGSSLQLQQYRESVMGVHLTYQQVIRGLPVYGSQVKLNLGKQGKLLSLFHKTLDPRNVEEFPNELKKRNVSLPAFEGENTVQRVIFKNKADPLIALAVDVRDVSAGRHNQWIFDKKGDTLFHRDLNRYFKMRSDTSARAFVYLPNPLITAEKTYGQPYWDNNDKTNQALQKTREPVTIRVRRAQADSFVLEDSAIRITNFSPPNTPQTFAFEPVFKYTRDSSAFEDVNAFYHLQHFHGYMQELGLGTMLDYQLPVDAHALSNRDNSRFSSDLNGTKGRLYFGEGGVDDAEDAEIIVHEFIHAVSSRASPGSYGTSRESQALEEGLCDYLACSYARHLSNYNWERLFTWDAGVRPNRQNKYWEGRWCTTDKQYPGDLTGGKYEDGEIWAGTFMQVWEKIGRQTTDKLVLSALNAFSRDMTMESGARLVLQADSILFQGQHYSSLIDVLSDRGLVNPEELGVPEQSDKAYQWQPRAFYQDQSFVVEMKRPVPQMGITLQTMKGQVLENRQVSGRKKARIPVQGLASGIYILHLQKANAAKAIKVFKP